MRQVIAVAAAHHRFVWIHPFYDGNGRVVRLMSHAMLKRLGVGSTLWSVARGLARNVGSYKSLLMAADGPRRNDLDGRGNLSLEALVAFCEFFLRTCVDQVEYMRSILEPAELLRRMEVFTEEEVRAGRLPKGSFLFFVRLFWPGSSSADRRRPSPAIRNVWLAWCFLSSSTWACLFLPDPGRLCAWASP